MNKIVRVLLCAVFALNANISFAAEVKPAKAKNVIFYVLDGAGPQSMGVLMMYARLAPGSVYSDRVSGLEKLIKAGSLGAALTYTGGSLATDSAASATQFATGAFTLPRRTGVDKDGNSVPTVMENAKNLGKSTGLVTTSFIIDATPAAFVAHEKSRYNRAAIAKQYAAGKVDVMLGGGSKYFSKEELAAMAGKTIGLYAEGDMPLAVENNKNLPTLLDMTKKAVTELEKNKKGFFLLVEDEGTDGAAHEQNAHALLHELIEADKTITYLTEYAKKHKDTLLIVMGDHDTGGFGFTYRDAKDGDNAAYVYEGAYFMDYSALDRIYNGEGSDEQNMVVWASQEHTSTPVFVISYNNGKATGFEGLQHTTDIAKKINIALGVK